MNLCAADLGSQRRAAKLPALTFLVDLPPRGKEFLGNFRVALGPRRRRVCFELNLNRVSRRNLTRSVLAHVCLVVVVLTFPQIRPDVPVMIASKATESTLLYYSAQSLPSVADRGGSAGGARGAVGGRSAFHPKQRIHVVRNIEVNPVVVDAPKLILPQAPINAANLLALSAPAALRPKLSAPVELARMKSRIARRDARTEARAVDAPHLQMQRKAIPELMVDTTAKSQVVLAPRPRPALPKRIETEQANVATPDLQMLQVKPVPPAEVADAHPAATRHEVVVSTRPGDVVGRPAEGKADALALSPKGESQPGIGNRGHGTSIARGSSTGSSSSGEGSGNSASGRGPGFNPEATTGASSAAGPSGAGTRRTSAIPGVEIRGGVVSLDSFGAKGAAPNPAARARRPAPITVVATSRSGGGLAAYGTFKDRTVYTVYIDTSAGQAVLQFASRDPLTDPSISLTPPDPLSTETPRGEDTAGVVFAGVLDESGHLRDVRVVSGAAPSPRLEEAVRRWVFHPALIGTQPIAVDTLIGIGVGVQ
jgi:hypothetical protein